MGRQKHHKNDQTNHARSIYRSEYHYSRVWRINQNDIESPAKREAKLRKNTESSMDETRFVQEQNENRPVASPAIAQFFG